MKAKKQGVRPVMPFNIAIRKIVEDWNIRKKKVVKKKK